MQQKKSTNTYCVFFLYLTLRLGPSPGPAPPPVAFSKGVLGSCEGNLGIAQGPEGGVGLQHEGQAQTIGTIIYIPFPLISLFFQNY